MKKLLVPLAVSILVACNGDPSGPGVPVDSLYYSHPDSVWKVVHNLGNAYNERDLERYVDCFTEDFEFWYFDHASPFPDWTFWELPYETLCHESLFTTADVDSIVLLLAPGPESASILIPGGVDCPCPFDLEVYIGPGTGCHAVGNACFTMVQDSSDAWRIALWYDESQTKGPAAGATWPDIKRVFLPVE